MSELDFDLPPPPPLSPSLMSQMNPASVLSILNPSTPQPPISPPPKGPISRSTTRRKRRSESPLGHPSTATSEIKQEAKGSALPLVGVNKKAKLQCPFPGCGETLVNSFTLKRHLRVHVPIPHQFVCTFTLPNNKPCGKGFPDGTRYKRHLLTHTGEKPFVCPWKSCGKSWKDNSNRRSHMWNHHNNKVPPKDSPEYHEVKKKNGMIGKRKGENSKKKSVA